MKKISFILAYLFIFANIVLATTVSWILLDNSNGKTLHIAETAQNKFGTYNVLQNQEGTEIIGYIVKISQNNKTYICGLSSYCPLNKEEGTVALLLTANENNYANKETNKNAEFKKPQGIIKEAHQYVCKKFYDSLIQYDTYLEAAKKYENEQDFKNALNSYKLAYQEATNLVQQGYSANRQAETLMLMAELSEKNEKMALARGYYQEIVNLQNLKDTSYQNKAIAKVNSIPKTKSEKAKEIGGGIGSILLYGVGIAGTILLNK